MKKVNRLKEAFMSKVKASLKRGEKLDFSKTVYVNNYTPITVIDHGLRPDGTEYGEFKILPYNLLRGRRHPERGFRSQAEARTLSQKEIISRFKKVHKGENLDYSEVVYKGIRKPVKIISHDLRPDGTEYGAFWQTPYCHLRGSTHPDISRDKRMGVYARPTPVYVNMVKAVHPNRPYDYSMVRFTGLRRYVNVICHAKGSNGNEHGIFRILGGNLLAGKGCPKCNAAASKAEWEIYSAIADVVGTENVLRRVKNVVKGQELDILIPKYNLAIEYNGLKWHSEKHGRGMKYHLTKTMACNRQGIRLIHVFEDEYIRNSRLVISRILHIIGSDKYNHVPEELCRLEIIDKVTADEFHESNNIGGTSDATIHYGLFFGNSLIAVQSYSQDTESPEIWTLARFSAHDAYDQWQLNKILMDHFIKDKTFKELRVSLDCCWFHSSDGDLYSQFGFELERYNPPNYCYTNGHGVRIDRNEAPNTVIHEYDKVWDCGSMVYVYHKR